MLRGRVSGCATNRVGDEARNFTTGPRALWPCGVVYKQAWLGVSRLRTAACRGCFDPMHVWLHFVIDAQLNKTTGMLRRACKTVAAIGCLVEVPKA